MLIAWLAAIGIAISVFAGIIFDWDLFFNDKYSGLNLVGDLGRNGARAFWGLLAVGGLVVGIINFVKYLLQ